MGTYYNKTSIVNRWKFFIEKGKGVDNMHLTIKDHALVSTEQFIEILTRNFKAYSDNNNICMHPAVFVQGQPGIGKSQAVFEIASRLEKLTNKRVTVKDVRLLLYTPIDLNGIPIPNFDKTSAVWLTPEIFKLDPSEDVINILFLDELTAAPTSIQAAAYQIALDKKIGTHQLPKNTFIIGAGNRTEDASVSFEMPNALKNRFIHFELTIDVKSWLKWAKEKEISNEIINFITKYPAKLNAGKSHEDSYIVVTPRSWEILSNLLKNLNSNIKESEILCNSILGYSLTHFFINQGVFEELGLPEIYAGKEIDIPKQVSSIERIVSHIELDLPNIIEDQITIVNVLRYLMKLPTDFSLRLIKAISTSNPTTYNLHNIKEFKQLILKIGDNIE